MAGPRVANGAAADGGIRRVVDPEATADIASRIVKTAHLVYREALRLENIATVGIVSVTNVETFTETLDRALNGWDGDRDHLRGLLGEIEGLLGTRVPAGAEAYGGFEKP